jgi:hypothetical protein
MTAHQKEDLSLALASGIATGIIALVAAGAGLHSPEGGALYGAGTVVFVVSAYVYVSTLIAHAPKRKETADLVGEWEFESETHTSQKTASGRITFSVSGGRITGRGQVWGQSENLIANIASVACGYELFMVYLYSGQDDNVNKSYHECILYGFATRPGLKIRGTWRQLDWDKDGRVGGVICFTRVGDATTTPTAPSSQAAN